MLDNKVLLMVESDGMQLNGGAKWWILLYVNSSDSTFTTELGRLHWILGATFVTESHSPRTQTCHRLG